MWTSFIISMFDIDTVNCGRTQNVYIGLDLNVIYMAQVEGSQVKKGGWASMKDIYHDSNLEFDSRSGCQEVCIERQNQYNSSRYTMTKDK